MNYTKLKLSLGDKIRLLFLGVIPEDKLPVRVVFREAQVIKIDTEKPAQSPITKVADDINTDEEKFHVPFFDLNDDDVKSNF